MIDFIDPDDHSSRLHVIIAMKKSCFLRNVAPKNTWLPTTFRMHQPGPRFELFNILDVAPLAAENAD